MIVQDFRDLVWQSVRTEGVPYIKLIETARLTALCQEQLNVYCARTRCLQSDSVTFTPVIGTSSYDTFTNAAYGVTTIPAAFSSALCSVRSVMINGAPLKIIGDSNAQAGGSNELLVLQVFPTYLTAVNDLPRAFWQEPPNKLRFNCPFDQVYSNCFVSGALYHSPLLTDNQTLDLSPEDIRGAAALVTAELLYPFNKALGSQLKAACDKQMEMRKGETEVKLGGTPARTGSGSHRRVIGLARSGGMRR